MSREVDQLIQYHAASGAPGVLTDINTPGVHAKHSAHYTAGTCTPPKPMDRSNGCEGCATDFAFVPAQSMSPGLLAIWTAFSHIETQLWELFHTGAPYWIKDGVRVSKSEVSHWSGGQALLVQHENHVHVALRPGHVLKYEVNPQPQPQDDNMADALTILYPSGAKTIATPDGGIFNAGTPFYGSMYDLPASQKQGVTTVRAITAEDPNNPVAGYKLWDQRGDGFDFTPASWHALGH